MKTLKDLNPWPDNPRKISPEELAQLRKSLFEFGDLSGIVFNVRTRHLVGGHQRVSAWNRDKARFVYVDKLRTPDRVGTVALGWVIIEDVKYSYREVEWDQDRETAANIAANQHGGEFVWEQLSKLVQGLNGKIDMNLLGFDEANLQNLLAADWKPDAIQPLSDGGNDSKNKDVIEVTPALRELLTKYRELFLFEDDVTAITNALESAIKRKGKHGG